MKRNLFIFFLILLPLLALSQKLYVGPTIGTRVATVTFFDDDDKKLYDPLPAFGFDGGIMVSRQMKKKYNLSAELIYSMKGKNVKSQADPTYRCKQRNHYIELPIYYSLEFKNTVGKGIVGQQRSYKWFIGGGPTISYWLGGKGTLESGYLKYEALIDKLDYTVAFKLDSASLRSESSLDKMNVSDPNRFQFAINFTGGISLEPVGFQKIVIAAHLELGQTFMSKNEDGYFPASFTDKDILKAKYYSLRFSVSYLFDTQIENKKRGTSTIKKKDNKKKR